MKVLPRYATLLSLFVLLCGGFILPAPFNRPAAAQTQRAMTFLDAQEIRNASAPAISPDGKWALYSLSVPDWKAEVVTV